MDHVNHFFLVTKDFAHNCKISLAGFNNITFLNSVFSYIGESVKRLDGATGLLAGAVIF